MCDELKLNVVALGSVSSGKRVVLIGSISFVFDNLFGFDWFFRVLVFILIKFGLGGDVYFWVLTF